MRTDVLDINGRIPTYKAQDDFFLLETLPDNKPSKRIIKTKKGLNAIKALIDIEKNFDISWYKYLKLRNKANMNDTALFYRGNKISFQEMFDKVDAVAKSMASRGLHYGDEIGVCVTNSPELVYIILAANKLGIKVNCFGSHFDKDYLSDIIDELNNKVIFVSDDNYESLKSVLSTKNIENLVMTSLSESLPLNPKKCDEYEPELDNYYHFDNKVNLYKSNNSSIKSFGEFLDYGKEYVGEIKDVGSLETDFLVTYTSGSTKIGLPKQIIHKNRSLITMGRFHDPELSGNPKIPGLRGLAHIHPESNTDIITCISDNLMQGWSVALEPEYDKDKALDYIILNKPNYLNITTSFMLEAAKEYLVDKKYHKNGTGRKLPFLLAAFTVGEKTTKGEEKFINRFLRESRAGSGISIKGLKLPFTTLSIGGGDCEHGGIYYTLWKSLQEKLYYPKLGKKGLGMLPVPYVTVTTLKQTKNGSYVECDYNEPGIIVANSYTNLSCYKNNEEATRKLIVTDNLGRNWVSCNVYGYIDKIGSVHVNGRIPNQKENICNNFTIDDLITLDTKNILSCTTVDVDDKKVINVQFQPLAKINESKVLTSIYARLAKILSEDEINNIYVRIIPTRNSFPLTGAGKRSAAALEKMNFEDCFKLSNMKNDNKEKSLVLKK